MGNYDSFEMTNMLRSRIPIMLCTCCVEKSYCYSDIIVTIMTIKKLLFFLGRTVRGGLMACLMCADNYSFYQK